MGAVELSISQRYASTAGVHVVSEAVVCRAARKAAFAAICRAGGPRVRD
jgi:hypothetical protein